MKHFWYYVHAGPLWEDYKLQTVIEAETITEADEIFQQKTNLDPKSQGVSVTLKPLP